MYTKVKNTEPPTTIVKNDYVNFSHEKNTIAPRFDLIISKYTIPKYDKIKKPAGH